MKKYKLQNPQFLAENHGLFCSKTADFLQKIVDFIKTDRFMAENHRFLAENHGFHENHGFPAETADFSQKPWIF